MAVRIDARFDADFLRHDPRVKIVRGQDPPQLLLGLLLGLVVRLLREGDFGFRPDLGSNGREDEQAGENKISRDSNERFSHGSVVVLV